MKLPLGLHVITTSQYDFGTDSKTTVFLIPHFKTALIEQLPFKLIWSLTFSQTLNKASVQLELFLSIKLIIAAAINKGFFLQIHSFHLTKQASFSKVKMLCKQP